MGRRTHQQDLRVVPGAAELELRASDRERERVLDLLRDASAEGRLTVEELEARTAQTRAARTHGGRDGLIRDLAGADSAAQDGTAPPSR